MGIGAYISGFEVVDYHSESFGTTIDEPIQAQDNKRLALIALSYLSAGTAHTISFLYAKDSSVANAGTSRNATSAGSAIGASTLNVTGSPKDPAGNACAASDIIAYQCTDGTWEFNTVASISTKEITLNAVLVKAVAAGAKVMIFGVVADGACIKLKATASVQKDWIAYSGPILVHPYVGEPFFMQVDNGTATGFLQNALFAHIDK